MEMGVIIERRGRTTASRATAAAQRVARAGVRLVRRVIRRVLRRGRAERHHPTARELFHAGRALDRAGQRSRAIDAYRAAIERNPTRPHWHFHLGRTLEHARDWVGAATAYRHAIERNPARPYWHFRLGRTLERLRHWTDAATAYRHAIDLDPTRAYWHVRLGHTLERTRDWSAAAREYERALALDDSRPAWRQQHAAALRRAHDREGLDRAVDALLEHEPDMPPLERRLLAADPRRFDVRRQVLRFVMERIDEIREVAAVPLPMSPQPPDRIWVYWGQGMRQAPAVVRRCHHELLAHHPRDQVVVLDDSTVSHHSDLPGYVHDHTHDDRTKYSDALRLDLLARHGGIWLDATCLVRRDLTGLLADLAPSGFFALRYRRARIASWLLAAAPGDRTLATFRAAQLVYWRHHDAAIDYYVLHHLFEALFHLDPEVQTVVEAMPQISARASSNFARAMFEPYDAQRFRQLLDGAFIHKLSHKTTSGRDLRGTMLEHLLEHGAAVGRADAGARRS